MPSSIHRDSLALPSLVPSTPISLPTSSCQKPAIKESVSLTSLPTFSQSNGTFVPNMSHLSPVIMKAFKSDSNAICPLSLAHVVLSRTHAADNSNGKSARYRHGIARLTPLSSRFRHNPPSSSRRSRGTYSIVSKVKKTLSLARLRLVAVSNDNSKGKSSRFKQFRLSLPSRNTRRVIARDLPPRLPPQVSRHFASHIIECVLAPPTPHFCSLRMSQLSGHAIARVRPRLFLPLRLSHTMTSSVSTDFQASCFLPEDPPHRRITPPSTATSLPPLNQSPPPSTETSLPSLDQPPPLSTASMSPPFINRLRLTLSHYLRIVTQRSCFRPALYQSLYASLTRLRSSRFQRSCLRNDPFRPTINCLRPTLNSLFRL